MKLRNTFALCTALALSASGCVTDGKDADPDGGTDAGGQLCDVGDPTAVCAGGPLSSVRLMDIDNYRFSSSLDIDSVRVRGGSPLVDLTFDWSGVTTDFMGHPLDPLLDVEMALITVWQASQEELTAMFNNDALEMSQFMGAVMAYPEDQFTSKNLVDFTSYGAPIEAPADVRTRDSYFNSDDPDYDPALYTHMLLIQRHPERPGRDISMMQFFTLDSAAPDTTVKLTNDSAKLFHEVDLTSLKRIPVSAGDPTITISWEDLSENAMGREFVPPEIDRVVVARYSMSVCDLENRFLDLEFIHDQWYEGIMQNVGVSYDLSMLTDANGAPFPGITDDGLWIVALFCAEAKCSSPAPHFLSILQPC